MNKALIILFIFCVFANESTGQVQAITELGDTILVFDNGTWKSVNGEIGLLIPVIGDVESTTKFNSKKNIITTTTEEWRYFGSDKKNVAISGSLKKVDDIYQISILYQGDLGCLLRDKSVLSIKLSNGQIIECIQISKSDCASIQKATFIPVSLTQLNKQGFHLMMNENIELLAAYNWEMMRIQGADRYADVYPSQTKKVQEPEQFFRQHLSALNRK